ncbi:MAG: protein kinase [Actinobacteria bacterium]|nr:protein kinase [Actinomycetota bacterium]MBO0836344.1 protein kinase [Actinomycetota bacterium]
MSHRSGVLAGRYRLDSMIASGGVGEVWRATDLVLDRAVAVKMLRSEYADQPQALSRFRSEAKLAGSVSHPAVAQVHDYGEAGDDGAPFLVMELVDGRSLADLLSSGPLDPATTMDVLAQSAAGLQAAHSKGLVHRDIKPANLLIGPSGHVKITDFGIAAAAGSLPITQTGMVVGTPSYLAPERLRGDQGSAASDLYSLGIVGYECMAGAPPFRGMPFEVAAAHQQLPLPPLPPSVPAGAAQLVAELTAKDPARRPRSAGAVADQAAKVRDSLTGSAPRHPAAPVAAPFRPEAPSGGSRPVRSDTLIDQHAMTVHNIPARPRYTSPPRRRRGPLVILTAALLGGLATWLVAAALPTSGPAGPTGNVPASGTVEVNSTALVGQQYKDVSKTLRQEGLTPQINFISADQTDSGQSPGTVISVDPSGRVPADSTVTLTVVQTGHHHGSGDGGE